MSQPGIIYAEKPQQCDLCGKVEELRPYGPRGEAICFECGMKDEATTTKMALRYLFPDGKQHRPNIRALEEPK